MGFNKDAYGNIGYTSEPPSHSRLHQVSVNWCDPCTWYHEAVASTNETLTDSGDGLTFNSANTNWIDTSHGRLTAEDDLDVKYLVEVRDNGVVQTQDDPFGGTQQDYSVNYEAGTVTFHSAPTGPITADYYYESGSEWVVKPAAGKMIRLTAVEVQFSANIDLTDTVCFQVYVGGSPYGSPTIYKTFQDYINEAVGSYPAIPAMGGASRGNTQANHIFRWPYGSNGGTIDLKSSLAMEIRVKLTSDTAFGGESAIATFYGISQDE